MAVNRSRKTLTEQDAANWALYAATLRPLTGRSVSPPPSPPPVPPPVRAEPARQATPGAGLPVARAPMARLIRVGEPPAGLDRATWRRLQQARYGAQWRVDLHGHAAQQAYRRFEQAVLDAARHGIRCIEVITGLGSGAQGGVLRRELPLWINLPHLQPSIVAASYAHAGNEGAVRLLIRKAKPGVLPPDPARGRSPRPDDRSGPRARR